MQLLKQSTASTVYVGPVLDSTGAAVTTAVVGDFRLIKNGTAATLSGATVTHDANGYYTIALTTSNTDTTGRLTIAVGNTAQSMSTHRYSVLLASVYDALITNATNATGGLPTATGSISALAGTIATATNITSASGVTLAATTHTGAVIPTVTSVTNPVTAGTVSDKTGYSLVAGTGLGNQTANITGNLSGSVGSVTGNVGGSVASVTNAVTVGTINANTITAASIAANSLDNKGNWNVGKTGYALTPTTGLGNQTSNITGSITSVTNRVTANTDQWNGVAVTGMPMPTFTLPTNFSSLFITAGGYVIVSSDSFGNTLIIPNLASQSSVNSLATSVAALPTATQNRDAVVNANPDDSYNASSWIKRVIIGSTSQREVAVTGAHHVAADIHEFQAGVITAADFAAGAIDANALAADAATEIANAVAATQPISRLDSMIESNGAGQFRFDTIALSMGAGGGGGTVNIVVEDRSITVE